MFKTYQKEDYEFQNQNGETYISTPELSSTPMFIGTILFVTVPFVTCLIVSYINA